jgi:magnesium transporter
MLVSCAAYEDGKKLGDIEKKDISAYVHRPECMVWVALYEPDPDELSEMQAHFGLHELAVEDAHHGHQRPKIEEYGDSLFAVLHSVDATGNDISVGEIDVFVGSNYVLSVRSGTEHGFASVRARCEREPQLLRKGPGFVFYALMDAVVDRYFPILDELEDQIEAVEEKIFSVSSTHYSGNSTRSNIQSLYELKQKLMTLKHATEPLVEASGKLHGSRVPPVCAGSQEYFRDVYDHLVRINQSIDALRDTVTTAISVNLSLIALQENETTRRIAAYAALLAVPTMIAGIYGMNFKHMPELSWRFGYEEALAIMAILDSVIFYRLRKAGWL